MSAKEQLAEAIAALPDSISVEEAVERLYRAFKLKQARLLQPESRSIRESFGLLHRPGQQPMSIADMDEAIERAVEDENQERRTCTAPK
jgi:hypothetical protein